MSFPKCKTKEKNCGYYDDKKDVCNRYGKCNLQIKETE